jgi:hypothetical protein
MNHTNFWVQLELEGVETEGQPLPDRFQRRFLEAPESKEPPEALGAVDARNSLRLGG